MALLACKPVAKHCRLLTAGGGIGHTTKRFFTINTSGLVHAYFSNTTAQGHLTGHTKKYLN
eukprot:20962-Rhodomonas_salina.1